MRIFKMKKSYLITLSVITGIFYLLAIGGLIYFVFYDDYFEYYKGKNTIRIGRKNLRYFPQSV